MDRFYAATLLQSYFPMSGKLYAGQIGFDHITKDYEGAGTTCGFLPHWLYWRLGCTDATLVNRYEPDSPFKYRFGDLYNNISIIRLHSAFVRIFGNATNNNLFLTDQIWPRAGDSVIIQGNPTSTGQDTSHVFVTLDSGDWTSSEKGTWRVAEAGQKQGSLQAGHISTRAVEYKSATKKWMVGDRWVIGWLDGDKLKFGNLPIQNDALAPVSTIPAATSTARGLWKVTESTGDRWYYRLDKGFRAFYAWGGDPASLMGSGVWIPGIGNTVTILWGGGLPESMVINGSSATGMAGMTPFSATKISAYNGKSQDTILKSYSNGHGLAMGSASA